MTAARITMEWLSQRTHIDEPDDPDCCMVWKGGLTEAGQPQASLRLEDGSRQTVLVRRVAWKIAHPKGVLGKELWAGVKCETPGCVHPDHVVLRARSHVMRGSVKNPAVRKKIGDARRAHVEHINYDALKRAIAESDESNVKIAQRIGCHHTTVAKYRTKLPIDSPFRQLVR